MKPRCAVACCAAMSAFAADAHGVHEAGAVAGWTFDGWVVGPLLVSLSWYATGYLRLRSRSTVAAAHHASAGWFLAGWLVLCVALVTPLHEAGERSFAAHMLEHELLMLVAAPLLVLSRPIGIALWAFPQATRRMLGAMGRDSTSSGAATSISSSCSSMCAANERSPASCSGVTSAKHSTSQPARNHPALAWCAAATVERLRRRR